jgi:tRNA (guanine10-N2)-dimethyltransferase
MYLAHCQKWSSTVFVPLCGTGSTVIEATLIGCEALGMDVQRRRAKGALRNVRHFGLNPFGIMVADARKLPLNSIGCVVTDPPYGKSATTLKSNTKAIVQGVLASAYELLGKGQRICIASPKTINVSKVGQALGYRHLESHFAYVHRALTREVAVFEKE